MSKEEFNLYLTKEKSYSSFIEMGKDVYLYPGKFYKYFQSKQFLTELNKDKKRYLQYLNLKAENNIPDVFIFKMSYILNPYMSLRYHKFKFDTYKELGEMMLFYSPIVDVYLKDFIIYNLLSSYMERLGDDHKFPHIYKKLKEIEEIAKTDDQKAYWLLAYFLADTKKLHYRNKIYDSPDKFFSSQLGISSLIDFSSSFLADKAVLTWLEINGYEERLKRFESLTKVNDANEKKAKQTRARIIEKKKAEEKNKN